MEQEQIDIVEPAEKPVEEIKNTRVNVIQIDEKTQGLVAKDNSELIRIIRVMMKGMAFPKSLDTEEKILAAWNMAAALKIPPAIAIQNMAVIHGSVCLWGQLPKALAEATGELEDYSLVLIDKEQNVISLANKNLSSEVWGAVCYIKRKNRTRNEYVFTMDDARRAKLDSKTGPWKDYTKIMLSRRVVAQAVKFEFPDALMGLEISEYRYDTAPDLKDVTPSQDRDAIAERLSKRALKKENENEQD